MAEQEAQPDSMLQLYRAALHHRRSRRELRSEAFSWLEVDAPAALAFERDGLLVVTNCGGAPLTLAAELIDGHKVLLSSVPGHEDPAVLPPDTTAWLARL